MSVIKILHIIRPSNLTGAPAAMLALLEELLNQMDCELACICSAEGPLAVELRRIGVKVRIVSDLVRGLDPIRDLRAFSRILGHIRAEGYGIVHTHSSKAGIIGRWAAKVAGVPVIVHTHHGIPWLDYPWRGIYRKGEKWTAFITHHLVVLTAVDRVRVLEMGISGRAKIHVIPNGLRIGDLMTAEPMPAMRAELGIPEGAPIVGLTAHLRPPKRPDLFLKMAAEVLQSVPECHFVVVGDGPLMPEMVQQAEELGLSSVTHFMGWRQDATAIMKSFTVNVLTTAQEGMPLTAIESYALGVPFVATDIESMKDVVSHGRTGLLVPSDPRALAEAVVRLLRDEALRTRLAKEARAWALEQYDIRKVAREVIRMYGEVAAR